MNILSLFSKPFMICVLLVTSFCFLVSVSFAQTEHAGKLSVADLQWVLNVPNTAWSKELQSIAVLLNAKKYSEADTQLDKWLKEDFNAAMLALPKLDTLFFHYAQHSLAPVYAKNLAKLNGPERINTLAHLGVKSSAVRFVAAQVTQNWWREDPIGMGRWLKNTPSFFEQTYLEEFIQGLLLASDGRRSPIKANDFSALASVFFALDSWDERRGECFTLIIEYWVQSDYKAASDFIFGLTPKAEVDLVLDNAISTLAYQHLQEKDFATALQLAARIGNADVREWSVRDFSLNVTSMSDKKLFTDWIKENPFVLSDARVQVQAHLNTIGAQVVDQAPQ